MNVPNEEDFERMSKLELLERLEELGYIVRGPFIPGMFRRSRFRRLVQNTGVGQIFNDFIRQVVFKDVGSGAPKLRNLHLHNGRGELVREVKIGRKDPPVENPPQIPISGGDVNPGDWAFNDSFFPDGHLSSVATLTIELEIESQPGVKFRGEVPAGPGETIETAWIQVFGDEPENLQADVFLWAGTDESTVRRVGPHVVSLVQQP